MTTELFKLLPMLAGFGMIAIGFLLAYRQSTLTWQHVIIFFLGAVLFCLGGVLAGVSGVQLQAGAGKDNLSVTIGQLQQLASAAQNTSDAAAQQAAAISALNGRVDQLQAAIQALHANAETPSSQAEVKRLLAPANVQGLAVNRYLKASGVLSQSAAMKSKSVLARLPHQ